MVAPEALPISRIEEFLSKKNRWIKEKLLLHSQVMDVKPKEYISGESFAYLGRNYRLKVKQSNVSSVFLVHGRLVVSTDEPLNPLNTQKLLTHWFRNHAEKKLNEKSKRIAKQIGVVPASIGIKSFKSSWGNCSVDKHIQFNWRVIMAPNSIVDYVVAHELCHILHHNHSPDFWKSVEKVFPAYKEAKTWLKEYGKSLEV